MSVLKTQTVTEEVADPDCPFLETADQQLRLRLFDGLANADITIEAQINAAQRWFEFIKGGASVQDQGSTIKFRKV